MPLDLDATGAAYTTGNAHKWLCAPKGSAYLHVRADRHGGIRPLVMSHGANDRRTDRTRFRAEFDWTGTPDPTPILAIPAALDFLAGLRPGGWPALMAANHALAIAARDRLSEALEIDPPAPDGMIGAMAAVPLPDDLPRDVKARLYDDHRIEVPVSTWPVDAALDSGEAPRARLLRVSLQAYNDIGQIDALASALRSMRGSGSSASRRTAPPPPNRSPRGTGSGRGRSAAARSAPPRGRRRRQSRSSADAGPTGCRDRRRTRPGRTGRRAGGSVATCRTTAHVIGPEVERVGHHDPVERRATCAVRSPVKSATTWRSTVPGNRAAIARACSRSAPASRSTETIRPAGPSRSASASVNAPLPDPRSAQSAAGRAGRLDTAPQQLDVIAMVHGRVGLGSGVRDGEPGGARTHNQALKRRLLCH